MQGEVSVPCMDEDCGNRAGAGAHVVGGLLHVHLGNLARLVLRVRPGQADTHASDALTSLITRISAMSPHGWVRVMLMANWGGGGVLTKHPLYKATRKQAPGPSWCRPLSRGAEGRRIWPAMTRSATCPSVARSSYFSLPSSGQNPLYPRKLTPAALPPLPGQQKSKSAYGSSRAKH